MVFQDDDDEIDWFALDKDYEVYECLNCRWEGYRKDMKIWLRIPTGDGMCVDKLACPRCNFYSGVTRDSVVDDD